MKATNEGGLPSSLRVAVLGRVVSIVIFFVMFFVFILVLVRRFSKEDISSYRPIRRIGTGAVRMYSDHAQWYASCLWQTQRQ